MCAQNYVKKEEEEEEEEVKHLNQICHLFQNRTSESGNAAGLIFRTLSFSVDNVL